MSLYFIQYRPVFYQGSPVIYQMLRDCNEEPNLLDPNLGPDGFRATEANQTYMFVHVQ